jgi:hypothetical protein
MGFLGAIGCEPHHELPSAQDAAPSPNASILPAPLVTNQNPKNPSSFASGRAVGLQFDSQGKPITPDAGVPPPVAIAANKVVAKDRLRIKDMQGVVMQAKWVWHQLENAPKDPEVAPAKIEELQKLTAHTWKIWLAEPGRLRISFEGVAFPIPKGSELRARFDLLGHVFVFPDANQYRVVPVGSLRSLFGDRRLDVIPLNTSVPKAKGAGKTLLGITSQRSEITSDLGTLLIDFIKIPEAQLSAVLLCRTLVELMAVTPETSICSTGQLPVHAEYRWKQGGQLNFEVTAMERKVEMRVLEMYCPPPAASFADTQMPPLSSGVFLDKQALVSIRKQATKNKTTSEDAPGEGIVAVNATDSLQYLVLDGVPIAWVMPGKSQYVIGPVNGRYSVQWRNFLGDKVGKAQVVEVPARVSIGEKPKEPKTVPGKSPPEKKKTP